MDDKKRELLAAIGLSAEMIDRATERDDLPRYFPPGEHVFAVEHVRQILNAQGDVMLCAEGRCEGSDVADLVGKRVAVYFVFRYHGELNARLFVDEAADPLIARCLDEAERRYARLCEIRAVDLRGRSLREIDEVLGHANTSYAVTARVAVRVVEKKARSGATIYVPEFGRAG